MCKKLPLSSYVIVYYNQVNVCFCLLVTSHIRSIDLTFWIVSKTMYWNKIYLWFINLSFDLTEGYFPYQQTDHDTENYWSVWNTITSVLNVLTYIITSYRTCCDIKDNVCLNLLNCRLSIGISNNNL